ncbi:DUF2339 domain-containing protein [Stakelama marina]|uniref:DUF2339 domain-containing protein n=1 Tax=Stakelama marina TaxID=2826939 RepID=A0A8T4IP42_9SPHN|nr:DUF2339 domain-containing protein [Stakelama marina]MBR0553876.1 DUF2339 domain-containing protein [Stakelama marina]
MTAFLLILIGALFAALLRLQRRVRRLEQRIDAARPTSAATEPEKAPAAPRRVQPQRETAPKLPKSPRPRFNFETLIGGRLPIWIGGTALVFAGFFLVRYTVEIGLLGPGVRTALAGLFALALIAASEASHRLALFREDPRVGQALSGAGVASAYATLYMAAALYHLVAPLSAFIVMLAITALALFLALRHGPPTAIMALVGGFAAPLVAGFDAAGLAPLLVYLALMIAALFGLAIRRGWAWLALAACAAGFAWANFLLFMLADNRMAGVGAFVVLLAIGASVSLPQGGSLPVWVRIAPLVAGLAQLILFAPALDFDLLAWALYLTLAAAAVALAWRDACYLPGVSAALLLVLLLTAAALIHAERSITPYAVAVATVLFAVPGHLHARRHRQWALVALGGTALPITTLYAFADGLFTPAIWAALFLVAALACAARSVHDHDRTGQRDPGLIGGAALAAALFVLGTTQLLGFAWAGVPLAIAMDALAAWAHRTGDGDVAKLPALAFLASLFCAFVPLSGFSDLIARSIMGELLPYPMLPSLGAVARALAVPSATAIAIALADRRQFARFRAATLTAAITLALLALYAFAKQPFAIATTTRFEAVGFLERAIITQACLGAGWALLRSGRAASLGRTLLLLGALRFVWFDCLIANPALVAQWVGPLPLFNLAVADAGLTALWFWTLPPGITTRRTAALVTILAILAAVRQAAHGAFLTGPIGIGENWGYSAALLALALGWLWRGIAAGRHDLRLFGLALLTIVTLKVFLIDASALEGVLRILSFLGLGLALIGIGWAYGRFLAGPQPAAVPDA